MHPLRAPGMALRRKWSLRCLIWMWIKTHTWTDRNLQLPWSHSLPIPRPIQNPSQWISLTPDPMVMSLSHHLRLPMSFRVVNQLLGQCPKIMTTSLHTTKMSLLPRKKKISPNVMSMMMIWPPCLHHLHTGTSTLTSQILSSLLGKKNHPLTIINWAKAAVPNVRCSLMGPASLSVIWCQIIVSTGDSASCWKELESSAGKQNTLRSTYTVFQNKI